MTVELVLLSRVAYRDVEISAPRLRSLLALLATELGRGCSTARLVDGLWPDQQPENPVKALQILVSRARSQLGADVIVSTPTGYRLALAEDAVDATAVVLSATVAAQRARAGDHVAALESAAAGLAFWAGPPADEGDDPLSALRRDRAATYASLWRARTLALARLDRYGEAVEPLLELHDRRPRDEEVLLELLRCEAATTGESAALTRYEDYRRSLRDELGTDPGAALQELHESLLQTHPPLVRRGIVHEPNPLLGRAADVTAVLELLHTARVTSIVGPGGLGKTRLAHAVAREAEQPVVHFVPLAGVAADADVVDEVATALGIGDARRASPWTPKDPVSGIAATVGTGLLVLDNCEHIIAGVAGLVRDLVAVAPELRILATGRTPLGLSSESVYLLPELSLSSAVELFTQRAQAARSDVELPPDLIAELCRHLDGLPLAIELAAARTKVMSVGEIARRLDDRFSLLRGRSRDAPERHQTLHAVVDWSWNLLDSAGQQAMRALSIFPGGFTADAAAYLVDDPAVLEVLVEQSLVKVTDTATGTRFSMLETVREFSAVELSAAGETDRAVDGMLAWLREFGVAHHDRLFGADPFTAVALFRAEHENLLRAMRHALARADGASVAGATAVLGSLWAIESNYPRMLSLISDTAYVLSHYRPAPEQVEVTRTALMLCTLYSWAIEGPRPMRALVALRRLPSAPPDTLGRAVASALQGETDADGPLFAVASGSLASYKWEAAGDLDRAVAEAKQALDSFAGQDSPWLAAMLRARIAEVALQVEDPAEVRRQLAESIPVLERMGAPDGVGLRLWMVLANLHLGAIDEAQRWLDSISGSPFGDKAGTQGYDVAVHAELAFARGEIDSGLALWRSVVTRLRDTSIAESWGIPAGRDPWVMEVHAVTLVAHAQHGRLDTVVSLVPEVWNRLVELLAEPIENPPPYLMELTMCGTLLVALGVVALADRPDEGARMIALGERIRYLRNFQSTISPDRVRAAAEEADAAAYADAVSTYAALDRSQLRAAAIDLLASASDRG